MNLIESKSSLLTYLIYKRTLIR